MIRATAEAKHATMTQNALAWMIKKKNWIVPIPGTCSPERMKENAEASEIALSAEEIQSLDDALNRMHLDDVAARWR